jgi:hypothetical protein
MLRISWLHEQQLVSQDRPCSITVTPKNDNFPVQGLVIEII